MKLSDISDLSKEDVLAALGLALKPTATQRVLTSAGLFGLGALVGATVALMLAPSSGRDLRDDLGRRLRRAAPDLDDTFVGDAADTIAREGEARSST